MGNDLMPDAFTAKENRFLAGIGFIIGLRQFGMMLVMPFLSVYGLTLADSTSALVGLSLGIYALMQGCLQVPYGIVSDRIGRKPVVIFGILVQVAGFAVAFQARSIQLLIFARALQGSGAINSVALSWVGDRFHARKSNKAMRITGTVSSVAIALSLICGTILQKLISVPQIFLMCMGLSVLALLYLILVLKEDAGAYSEKIGREPAEKKDFEFRVILTKPLIRLFSTGFISNFLMTGVFFVMPHLAKSNPGGNSVLTIILAILIMFPAMRIVNRFADKNKTSLVQTILFAVFTMSIPCMFARNLILDSAGIIIFFAGIMCQYYLINAGVNRLADKKYRATINGVANTISFVGSFLGGVATGVFWDIGLSPTMAMLAGICFCGLIIACTDLSLVKFFSSSIISRIRRIC